MIEHRKKNRLLIYDPFWTGHHYDYLRHLVSYISNMNQNDTEVIFLVNEKVAEKLETILEKDRNLKIQSIQDKLPNLTTSSRGLMAVIRQMIALGRYCSERNVQKVFLPYAPDDWQLALVVTPQAWLKAKCSILVFNPWAGFGTGFMAYYYRYRRSMLRSLLTAHSRIYKIFVIADPLAADILNGLHRTKKFVGLPDPVPSHIKCQQSSERVHSVVDATHIEARINFLFFGALNKRKGLFLLFDALELIPDAELSRISITLAGQASTSDRDHILALIEEVQNRDAASISVCLEHVDESEIPSLFGGADYVLCIYERSEASSGVLGYAAFFDKPVISNSKGYVGRLVNDYCLGLPIRDLTAKRLARVMTDLANRSLVINNSLEKRKYFLEERSPKAFASQIVNSIFEGEI